MQAEPSNAVPTQALFPAQAFRQSSITIATAVTIRGVEDKSCAVVCCTAQFDTSQEIATTSDENVSSIVINVTLDVVAVDVG